MKPFKVDKLRREIKSFAAKEGCEFSEVKPRRGSHGTWVIKTVKSGDTVYKVVIPIDVKELSPGVLRSLIAAAEESPKRKTRDLANVRLTDDYVLTVRVHFAEFLKRLLRRK